MPGVLIFISFAVNKIELYYRNRSRSFAKKNYWCRSNSELDTVPITVTVFFRFGWEEEVFEMENVYHYGL